MIGTSTPEYFLIRFWVLIFSSIAPVSILYCLLTLIFPISPYRAPWPLEWFMIGESSFYFLVYLPRKLYFLQHPAVHPAPLPREERRKLFQLCFEHIPDPERYLRKWFLDAPLKDIRKENVKDFLRWAFLNNGDIDAETEEELRGYVLEVEDKLGIRLEEGRGKARCLTLTINRVDMWHRALLWYLIIVLVDGWTFCLLRCHSFRFHRTSITRSLAVFPPRPLTFLTWSCSPAKNISYWHRPHLSNTKLPILFIHGIGIGLYPYVDFLVELNKQDLELDDSIGVIALELLNISFRITHAALAKEVMCEEIQQILAKHGWNEFVLVSHSYGSVISTHLLKTPRTALQIKAMVLIDPITFLLQLPDVAYNFTYRKPARANEHQLYYFASKDMGVAHTLFRHFFWSENILWKHEIEGGLPVTVSLSGRDLIVDTRVVRDYLTDDSKWSNWSNMACELDVLWFDDLDHAQVFDRKATRKDLLEVVRRYSSR